MTGELPRVEVQPVVGDFNLVAVNDFLLENTVAVSQTVTPGREVERGQTVEEASGQSTKTAVSEGSVVFLGDDIFNAKTEIGKTSCR